MGMPDYRSYFPNLSPDRPSIQLSSDESHHLVAVNRAREGAPVVVFDGKGSEWFCELKEANKRAATLEGQRFLLHDPLPYSIALAQAIPKGKGLEGIIRKATELGIQDVYPLVTERTETRIKGDRVQSKSDKWLTAAIEGAKQSGNPFLPRIHPLSEIEDFLEKAAPNLALKLIASLQPNTITLKAAIESLSKDSAKSGVFLVGPEGDLSHSEYERINAAGFQPITLGPYVLKCETAATSAISILRYEWGGA